MADSVSEWLNSHGLQKYSQTFAANDISLDMLPELGPDDLRELGLTIGDRKRFERALGEPGAQNNPAEHTSVRRAAGERRQLTVVFSDLVGSTALAERLDLEDYRQLIGHYQVVVTEVVKQFGGTVARYMGDGVMIYFGYPHASEDDPERAVRASLTIIERLGASEPIRGERADVRIGIATGLVVVGDLIGEGMAEEHAVLGGIPNLAARLQGCADVNTVVVADTTRRLASSGVQFDYVGEQTLKGISAPVKLHRAVRVLDESRFNARTSRRVTPLVGRNAEWEELRAKWELSASGEGQCVVVSGEAGVGKSRLIEELRRHASPNAGEVSLLQCSTFHQNSPLHPALHWIQQHLVDSEPLSDEQTFERLQGWCDAAPEPPPMALLASLLGLGRFVSADASAIGTGSNETGTDGAEADKRALFGWLGRRILHFADEQPVLVIVEDVHWADASTLEWLSSMTGRLHNHRVLLLVTHRPEHHFNADANVPVSRLALDRLDKQATIEIVQFRSDEQLPTELATALAERSDGIPLFVEELTTSVLQTLADRDANDAHGEIGNIAIPDTLHDSLMGRLDRLGSGRRLAQIGAAIGRKFPVQLLADVTDMQGTEFEWALEELVGSGLVQDIGGAPELSFQHALVREVAHESLLRSERKRIHAQIAHALQAQFDSSFDTAPETIGRHLYEAESYSTAAGFFSKAGEEASRRSANAEAVGHYRAALQAIEQLPESTARDELELELRVKMNHSLGSLHGWGESAIEENFARVSVLSERTGATQYLLPSGFMGWSMYYLSGSLHRGIAVAQQLLTQAERHGDEQMALVGHRCMGINLMTLGDPVGGEHHHAKVEALYAPERDDELTLVLGAHMLPTSMANRAVGLWFRGQVNGARTYLQRARDMAATSDHANTIGNALVSCAVSGLTVGESIDVIARDLEAADIVIRKYSLRTWMMSARFAYRFVQLSRGHVKEALEGLRKDAGGPQPWYRGRETHVPGLLAGFAQGVLRAGLPDVAYQLLENAERRNRVCEGRWGDPEVKRVRGVIQAAMGGSEQESADCFIQAIETARDQDNLLYELRALNALADIDPTAGVRADIERCAAAFDVVAGLPEIDAAARILDAGAHSQSAS